MSRWVVSNSANSPSRNTGLGSCSLLQGIFPIQGSNSGLLHCRWILYQLSHQGSSRILKWVAYPFSSGSAWPRNRTRVSCIAGRYFTSWATREAHYTSYDFPNPAIFQEFMEQYICMCLEGFAEMISCKESVDRGSDCYLQDLEKPYFNKKSLQTSLEPLESTSLFFLNFKILFIIFGWAGSLLLWAGFL